MLEKRSFLQTICNQNMQWDNVVGQEINKTLGKMGTYRHISNLAWLEKQLKPTFIISWIHQKNGMDNAVTCDWYIALCTIGKKVSVSPKTGVNSSSLVFKNDTFTCLFMKELNLGSFTKTDYGSLDLLSCGKEKEESNSEQEEHHLKTWSIFK